MSNSTRTQASSGDGPRAADLSPIGRFFKATELDTRMLGMIGALLLIWILFDIFSGGLFLTPRNLWNLSVQTASIAVMATGMVLVIVTRNIDLSVGSVLGFVGMIMAVTQAEILPQYIGFDNPFTWLIAVLVGVVIGGLIGALHGYVIAYLGVPAFIVTLGGLLVWRGAAWWVTSGRTVAPMDSTFRLIGGGPAGSIGAMASWIVGLVACAAIIALIASARRQRQRFQFPLRPLWADGRARRVPGASHRQPARSEPGRDANARRPHGPEGRGRRSHACGPGSPAGTGRARGDQHLHAVVTGKREAPRHATRWPGRGLPRW